MRGSARPWVAALLALALALLAVSIEHHGIDDTRSHACGLCLMAHAQEPPAAAIHLDPPRAAERVEIASVFAPREPTAPQARARGPPASLA